MDNLQAFREQVALKYQLYNGLFLTLPFEDVRAAGILLPVFAEYCKAQLAGNRSPVDIVNDFFAERGMVERNLPEGVHTETAGFDEMAAVLFRFMQFVERQVVLFDALEDTRPGDTVSVTYVRNGRERTTEVALVERPSRLNLE